MTTPRRRTLLGLFIVAGIASGVAAVAFHQYVGFSRLFLIDVALRQHGLLRIALTVLIPVGVAALLGFIVQRFEPSSEGANLARVRRSYATDPALLDWKTVLFIFVLTPLSLGSGAPLGPEGPIVVVASGLSMWVARLLKLPRWCVLRGNAALPDGRGAHRARADERLRAGRAGDARGGDRDRALARDRAEVARGGPARA